MTSALSPTSQSPSPSHNPSQAETAPHEASTDLPRIRSVQFFTPANPMSRSISPTSRSHYTPQAESSADETTPIVGKEKGNVKNKSYETVGAPSVDNGVGSSRQRTSSSARRRKAASGGEGDAVAGTKEKGGWWKDLAEKYGSVELDNKGSVARDHLALGSFTLCTSRILKRSSPVSLGLTITRAHFPSLASHLSRLRLYRYSCHPALPPQHHHLRA